MSETVARQRPSVDLDDFERHLRGQAQQAHHHHHAHDDDPLAELARIVGEQADPYDDMFAQQPVAGATHLRPSFQPHGRQSLHTRQEPSLGAPPPRFAADFAAIEAGLRGATAAAPHAPHHDPHGGYEPEAEFGPPPQSWATPPAAKVARAGSRRPVYAMAASIAIAVVGIGVAFAYKGSGSSPREIRTIMAAAGPTKEQPPADQTAATAEQDASAAQQAATKLVSREEQPVDLAQAVQDNAAARGGTDATSVPVPPSPGQAAGTMSPDYSTLGGATPDATSTSAPSPAYNEQGGFGVGMPKPKRVKSVSVTPDGRIVNEAAAADSMPSVMPVAVPAAKSSDRAGPVTGSPLFPEMPKSTGRATKTAIPHRVAEAAPGNDDGDAAAAPKPAKPAKKAKPVKVASAETGAVDTTVPTDTAAAEAAAPAGAGSFAVQLAAPGSEADARSTTSRLLKKYSGALHGRRLGFHRADSNGRTVYRVRVSSLSKDDATSLCSKLKADGGTCFVAKN